MIPVYQRGKTDCVRACVAAILEIPYEEVPDFDINKLNVEMPPFFAKHGLGIVNMSLDGGDAIPDGVPAGYTLGGLNPRTEGEIGHSVICKDGYIVFDPYPYMNWYMSERRRPDQYTFIYSLDPSLKVRQLTGD